MRDAVSIEVPEYILPRGWKKAVGFFRERDRLHVSFPKVYDDAQQRLLSDSEFLITHLILLIRVIASYSRDVRLQIESSSYSDIAAGDSNLLDWLEAAVDLFDEYSINGLYWAKEPQRTRSERPGSIDWPRSLNSGATFLQDDVPLMLGLVRRTRSRSSANFLHRLHSAVINEISELLTGRSIGHRDQGIDPGLLGEVRRTASSSLAALYRTTYSDRGRYLLGLIERYLRTSDLQTSGSANATGYLLFNSNSFELIWEHMLRVTVSNISDSIVLPSGTWEEGGLLSPGIKPRVDFGYDGRSRGLPYAIFDAKDKVRDGQRAGSEADHYKQILYAQLLGKAVLNFLLFPSLKLEQQEGPFLIIGCHYWDAVQSSSVIESFVDYEAVSRAFIMKRKIDPEKLLMESRKYSATT